MGKYDTLNAFLGAENVEDLRRQVKDLIVERIREDLNEYSSYVIDPDELLTYVHDAILQEIRADLVREVKGKVTAMIQKKVEEML